MGAHLFLLTFKPARNRVNSAGATIANFLNFVNDLSKVVLGEHAQNQYACDKTPETNKSNGLRRSNLLCYLEHLSRQGPKLLLIGEAPGYRGCAISGVPFTSEQILMDGVGGSRIADKTHFFGIENGYRRVSAGGAPVKEGTATMIWEGVRSLQPLPLLWNAFPFHPHRPGRPQSNRRPTSDEIALGLEFLTTLMGLYAIQMVIAVGRVAQDALSRAGITAPYVRHPSYGGKQAFLSGLAELESHLPTR